MTKKTTENILKNLMAFSLPYLLACLLQNLYGMADMFIIGQFGGAAATTSVAVGSQVMHMVTVMLIGLSMGTTVTIGQALGADNRKKISAVIGNTIVLFAAVAIIITAVLLILNGQIVSVMSTPAEAVQGTREYLIVCFAGIPFITAYNVISSIFRGMGDSRSPLYFVAIACVINIGLDYLFIGAMDMGPMGAALGTVIAQTVSVICSLIIITRRHKELSVSREDIRPNRIILKEILYIGVPVTLQDGFIQISFIIITIIANSRGLTDAAAVGVVEKIISFLFLVPSAMLSTVSALGARYIGAGEKDECADVLKKAMMIACGFGLVIAVIVQFLSLQIVSWFTTDSAVAQAGSDYFRSYVWDCMFAGVHFCFSGYFCARGKSGISFLHNVISIIVIRVPGAYLASMIFPDNLFPMGLASTFGSVLSSIICVVAFIIVRRKDRNCARNPIT